MPFDDPQPIDPLLGTPADLGPWVPPDHWFLPADAGAVPPPPADVAPPIHPADLAAGPDIPFGPPGPGMAQPPVTPPESVATIPDITVHPAPPHEPAPPLGMALPVPPSAPVPPPGLPFGPNLPGDIHYAQSVHDFAGNLDRIPDPAEQQRALNDLYATHPVDAAELEARRARERDDYITRRKAEIIENDRRAAQQAHDDLIAANKATDEKMAQVGADIDRIAKTKVDDGLSPFQRVAGVVAAIVGGLYQGRTGAANNIGLDALNKIIDRNMAEQRAALDRQMRGAEGKRSLLAQEYARHGDIYRAEEALRGALLKSADEQLAIEQQNYDPQGTTGRFLAKTRAATTAAIVQGEIERRGKLLDQNVKERNAAREEALAVSTISKNRADIAKTYADIDKIRSELGENAPVSPAQIRAENPGLPEAAYPTSAVSRKDFKQRLDTYKIGQDVANQSPENLRGIPGVTVTDPKTGKAAPFVATGRPEFIEAAKKKKAAVVKIVGLMDDAIRTRSGWTTDTGNSEERQQLNAIWNTVQLEIKEAYSLGQISESDANYMNGVAGTNDPSKLRDPIAGIRKARQIFENNLNVDLHGVGLPEDQRYSIPDLSHPAVPKETVADKELKMVLGDPEKVAKENFAPDGSIRPARPSEQTPFPEQTPRYKGDIQRPDYRGHGLLLQKQQLDSWAQRAREPGAPGHDEAWTAIADVASRRLGAGGAATAEIRDYARALLTALQAREIDRIPSAIPEESR